jgi:hypothetical protein
MQALANLCYKESELFSSAYVALLMQRNRVCVHSGAAPAIPSVAAPCCEGCSGACKPRVQRFFDNLWLVYGPWVRVQKTVNS